ncbi:MAG: ABC transporter ATP-binding protein [Candidatus Rokubacteria bacterium 13_1_40CM_69_27]|nr:MAG: ABC transporter ATP-binding protein [Candidatus Rokubacteria bacterium 13_1_40CM_69_27]OLC36828.1 MAG: ABC transporter ATP-binding protein [Candidatus Rokubacteria bacterium 13_1_40CM_4_69_5]
MKSLRVLLALVLVGAVAVTAAPRPAADAQSQTIKIGLLYDHSGPFSAAGSLNCWRGAKMIIDYVNERGGVMGKYKIVQVDGDSQSKTEAAINEAERLLNVEKVDILAGIYSSAHAVPLAEKVDRQKKFLWITTAIADAVVKDRNLQFTFRPQPNGSLFGEASVQYVAHYAKDRLRKAAKDIRAAIIYEDGPYGTGVAASNEAEARKQGMQVVLKEGFSAQAPDLSSLVTKLRASRPDVIFHTGYNPDIALFLRQAKEQGLRTRIYVGHGAGHSQLAKLKEAFGNEVEGFHTTDPPASQLIDPKRLKPGVWDLTQEMVKRYKAFEPTIPVGQIAPHVSMGFNNMWILLNDVLPRAIQQHGGFGPEALAKAARETDIPEGGTMQGYGVKFQPAGHPMAGQNMRAIAAVFQVVDGEFKHVYPPVVASLSNPPVLLPASSPFAFR